MTEPIPRRAARVLLLDAQQRLLLFHAFDPGRPDHTYWFTPGGGLDEGETMLEAAARELYEETGLRVDAARIGAPVWRQVTEFPFGGLRYRQDQEFFVVRVDSWQVDTSGFDEVERNSVDGHRWWTLGELAATDQRYYPENLPELLRGYLEV
ncbi:NUDIX hydrolase [Rugosimonospora acidiphila]|uniref:NUDIX hydrolase n=1 Tax=Rugosimonospora acidiphila TaxID=556531 RepID=A0ABP9RN35_9ACTN